MTSKLQDKFIHSLREKTEHTKALSTKIRDYKEKVFRLYDQVDQWLRPAQQSGLLSTRRTESISISESVGITYKIRKFEVFLPTTTVELIPKGHFVIGANGRLDIVTPVRSRIVVLYDGKWRLVDEFDRSKSIELTEDTFLKTFLDLMGADDLETT